MGVNNFMRIGVEHRAAAVAEPGGRTMRSADHREAVAAFQEKRSATLHRPLTSDLGGLRLGMRNDSRPETKPAQIRRGQDGRGCSLRNSAATSAIVRKRTPSRDRMCSIRRRSIRIRLPRPMHCGCIVSTKTPDPTSSSR